MTTAADVMQAVHLALTPGDGRSATDADDRIARPGDLPTQSDQYPRLKLRYVNETKISLGRNSVGFTTSVTIRLMGEVSEPVAVDDDINVSTIEASLTALKIQCERAIINSYPLFEIVQQLASVSTSWAFTAQATHLAGITADFTFEIIETAADFCPIEVEDLAAIAAIDTNHPGVGLAVAIP